MTNPRRVIVAVDAERGLVWTRDLSIRMSVAPERLRVRFRQPSPEEGKIDFWFFHATLEPTGILELGEVADIRLGWPILERPNISAFEAPIPSQRPQVTP